MSRIDELLSRLCPEGVAFKTLGELGELVRGNGLPKVDFTESGVGAIHYGQIYTYYGTFTTRTLSHVAPDTAAKLAKVDPGDVIITNTSENLEDVGKAVAWLGPEQIVTGGHATIFKHHQDPKFISYWLQSPSFQSQKKRLASGTKVIDVSAKQLAVVRVPVPPLEVQREIVRILDTFSELETELGAELEARRVQYEYYRHALLTSVDSGAVKKTAIGELIKVRFGDRITKSGEAGFLYPVFGGGGESFRTDTYNREDDWLISRFAMSQNCVRRVQGRFWLLDSGFTFDMRVSDVHKDFFGYMLLDMQPTIFATSTKSAQKNIDIEGFKRLEALVPPLKVQREIVETLDTFDAMVNNLSEGLPAELRARRQQYEYYRDRLLTFKELPGE